MHFSLFVYASPHIHQASHTAYRFAEAAIERGHTIQQVFFYLDGVYHATHHSVWQTFGKQHKVPLYLCRTLAEEYGLTDCILAPFQSASLVEFFNALDTTDRLLTFGA